ncbi:MAG TPA: TAXI family TRAP transporter solute-binding subunit [Xanthobacteraceae bacterium]|nr:TAXI family TRAP transporter solute-binding subunit [Xanthobacteraceae bacterium]
MRTGFFARVFAACAIAAALLGLFSVHLSAQVIPKALSAGGTDAELREQKNAWTVGIVGGLYSGTYMRLVDDMASALNDGDNLRILPIVSYGAASNVDDLLYLRGVDAAITQSDVLEYFRNVRKTPNLEQRVQYIIRLPTAELHILARDDVHSLQDLRGKKVNFGPAGTGASLTGNIVFQRLGIDVQQVLIPQPSALQKLQAGEIDAIARVIPKPVDFFSKIPPNSGLHLLNIPFTKMFEDHYTLGEFTKQDYPNLLDGKDRIDTIAVPAVLAVFNWGSDTDRYRKVQRFVQYLFNNFSKLQRPPYHPKWRDVNLAATVPGWTRFGVAQDALDKMEQQNGTSVSAKHETDFDAYLGTQPHMPANEAERQALFKSFLQWQAERQAHGGQGGQGGRAKN